MENQPVHDQVYQLSLEHNQEIKASMDTEKIEQAEEAINDEECDSIAKIRRTNKEHMIVGPTGSGSFTMLQQFYDSVDDFLGPPIFSEDNFPSGGSLGRDSSSEEDTTSDDTSTYDVLPQHTSLVPSQSTMKPHDFGWKGEINAGSVPRFELQGGIPASYHRVGAPLTSNGVIKPQLGAKITRSFVLEQNMVIVSRRSASTQSDLSGKNIKSERKNEISEGELALTLLFSDDKKIPEEEAICKFCFNIFKEENALQTLCKCPYALAHQECADDWSRQRGNKNCEVCEKEVQHLL